MADGERAPGDDPRRVVLVGRPGCHLCEDARRVVAEVAGRTGTGWTEVSVLDDPGLLAEYAELVPVVLVDGAVHATFRVDPDELAVALAPAADARPAWLRRWWRGDERGSAPGPRSP